MLETDNRMHSLVETRRVKTFSVTSIDGEYILPETCPFGRLVIPDFSFVVTNHHVKNMPLGKSKRVIWQNLDFVPNRYSYSRASRNHGRSYDIQCDEYTVPNGELALYWQDEYGNVFSDLTIKGNNLEQPDVYHSSVSPAKFTISGMQDSKSVLRVVRASKLLRKNHVDTEIIDRVLEPLELPHPQTKQIIPRDEFKRALVTNLLSSEEKPKHALLSEDRATQKDLPAVMEYLNNATFLFTIRSLQTSDRIGDFLTALANRQNFELVLDFAFDFINKRNKIVAEQNHTEKPFLLDSRNKDHLLYYFVKYLPEQSAKNLAKIHNLNLVHGFPHSLNFSTVGSLYDLDSVRGVPLGLGDADVTGEEIYQDVKVAFFAFTSLYIDLIKARVLPTEAFITGTMAFLKEYVSNRTDAKGLIEIAELISEATHENTTIKMYLDALQKIGGIQALFRDTQDAIASSITSFPNFVTNLLQEEIKEEKNHDKILPPNKELLILYKYYQHLSTTLVDYVDTIQNLNPHEHNKETNESLRKLFARVCAEEMLTKLTDEQKKQIIHTAQSTRKDFFRSRR